jgi:arylsulfatase A-like enzyme
VCSDDALDRIVALAYGAAPGAVVERRSAEARCQRAISRGIAQYVRTRVPGRFFGWRGAPRSSRLIDRIGRACAEAGIVSSSSGRLPAFAGACADIADGTGNLDEATLGRCLRAAVEAIIDDVAPASLRPNIILILTDDQRWDTLQYMPKVTELLVEQGINFPNGFVTTSLCCPSRASILSGEYGHNHGMLGNTGLLTGDHDFDHDNNLARWLSDAGYRTALFGKYLNYSDTLGESVPEGWDEWQIMTSLGFYDYTLNINGTLTASGSAEEDYSTDYLGREVVEFVKANRNRPFFLIYSPYAPHDPATPAARHQGAFEGIPLWRPPNFREPFVNLKPGWVRFMRLILADTIPASDAFRILQLESLLAIDEAVADISDTLERLGLTDNTMVVLMSDNGKHWGEHWWDSKFTSYEEAIRVPYVIRYPARYPMPGERDAMVLNIDLAPTFARIAGASIPHQVDGQSLLPVLDGISQGRDDFMFEAGVDFIVRPSRGVRTRRWKYIQTSEEKTTFEELYDLENDPYELFNLAFDSDYAAIRQHLADRLEELKAE